MCITIGEEEEKGMKKRVSMGLIVALGVGMLSGCFFAEPEIKVEAKEVEVKYGETVEIKATGEHVEDYHLHYVSEDGEIATVDEKGVVTGVKEGATRIAVTLHKGSEHQEEENKEEVESAREGMVETKVEVKVLDNPELRAKLEEEQRQKEEAERKAAEEKAEAERIAKEEAAKKQAQSSKGSSTVNNNTTNNSTAKNNATTNKGSGGKWPCLFALTVGTPTQKI